MDKQTHGAEARIELALLFLFQRAHSMHPYITQLMLLPPDGWPRQRVFFSTSKDMNKYNLVSMLVKIRLQKTLKI